MCDPRSTAGPWSGLAAERLADAELACLDVGERIGDGFLEVRRDACGLLVYDGEANTPVLRRATLEEARDFVVAIHAASGPQVAVGG